MTDVAKVLLLWVALILLLLATCSACTVTIPLEPPNHDFTPLQLQWIKDHLK